MPASGSSRPPGKWPACSAAPRGSASSLMQTLMRNPEVRGYLRAPDPSRAEAAAARCGHTWVTPRKSATWSCGIRRAAGCSPSAPRSPRPRDPPSSCSRPNCRRSTTPVIGKLRLEGGDAVVYAVGGPIADAGSALGYHRRAPPARECRADPADDGAAGRLDRRPGVDRDRQCRRQRVDQPGAAGRGAADRLLGHVRAARLPAAGNAAHARARGAGAGHAVAGPRRIPARHRARAGRSSRQRIGGDRAGAADDCRDRRLDVEPPVDHAAAPGHRGGRGGGRIAAVGSHRSPIGKTSWGGWPSRSTRWPRTSSAPAPSSSIASRCAPPN